METVKKTAKPKAAVLKAIAEWTRAIEEIDAKLTEQIARQAAFLQRSYVSQKVSHKTFGEGVIVEQKEDIIQISFAESGMTKAFQIPPFTTGR